MTDRSKHSQEPRQCDALATVLAISARELADMLGVSLRQIWRLNASGKLPKPIRLGGSVRWDREEITDWFRAGCPDRQVWQAKKEVTT